MSEWKNVNDGESALECEGACDNHVGHSGQVRRVHVLDPRAKYDWGHFNYCRTAINADISNGLEVTDIKQDTPR